MPRRGGTPMGPVARPNACPIERGKCTICGGSAKRSVHPRNPDLYPWQHSYPHDLEDANHAPVVGASGDTGDRDPMDPWGFR